MISPAMWSDARFAPLDPVSQLLYIGMITLAEDCGQVKGCPAEFRMKLQPWGMIKMEDFTRALKAVLVAGLSVEYGEDLYFLPGWFKHQSQRYYAASKLPPIPTDILDKYPDYRDAYYEALHAGRTTRSANAAQQRRRVPTPDVLNPTTLTEAMQIEALAEESEDSGMKVTALLGMARAARPKVELTAGDLRGYLVDLADTPGGMVEAACRQLRKEKPYMCHVALIVDKAIELFGETSTKKPQRALDADGLMLALSRGRNHFDDAVAALTDSERRKSALMDVWNRMDQISGGSIAKILMDIYEDVDMIDDRIVTVWQEVSRRKEVDDEVAV